MRFAILGAGEFGSVLGEILEDNLFEVEYYDPRIKGKTLDEVVSNSDVTVFSAPSNAAPSLLPNLPKNIPLVVASKGFLNDNYFRDFEDWMVLSGPGFAKDIKEKLETHFTVTDERIALWLRAEYLFFDQTDDRVGVLMCGALKNVYAILAGIKGLERESEAWRTYITEVSEETQALLSANFSRPETIDLFCGREDLELTCGLPSRNYEFGLKVSQNPSFRPEKTVEGVAVLKKIRNGEITVPDEAKNLREIIERSEAWS